LPGRGLYAKATTAIHIAATDLRRYPELLSTETTKVEGTLAKETDEISAEYMKNWRGALTKIVEV
jgi:hypothetical protein